MTTACNHVDVGPCGRESSFHSRTSWPQRNMQIGEKPNLSFGSECYSSGLYDSVNVMLTVKTNTIYTAHINSSSLSMASRNSGRIACSFTRSGSLTGAGIGFFQRHRVPVTTITTSKTGI